MGSSPTFTPPHLLPPPCPMIPFLTHHHPRQTPLLVGQDPVWVFPPPIVPTGIGRQTRKKTFVVTWFPHHLQPSPPHLGLPSPLDLQPLPSQRTCWDRPSHLQILLLLFPLYLLPLHTPPCSTFTDCLAGNPVCIQIGTLTHPVLLCMCVVCMFFPLCPCSLCYSVFFLLFAFTAG